MAEWTWFSFSIGILVGIVITVIIVWILYATRVLFFSNCPSAQRQCVASDYFNDPAVALSNGFNVNEILFLEDVIPPPPPGSNLSTVRMVYKRPVRTSNCTPGTDQIVPITQPQFCQFQNESGGKYTGQNFSFGSKHYAIEGSATSAVVNTTLNCNVSSFTGFPSGIVIESGTPILNWLPA
jgi:hypothetical protein